MKLHFDEPIDKTKENSAIFEFFEEDYTPIQKVTRVKGKSLARLIEERKLHKYYHKKKHLNLQLKLLQILVTVGIVLCLIMIGYLLVRGV